MLHKTDVLVWLLSAGAQAVAPPPRRHLLQLSGFTVESGQEKSGRLSDIIAVHQQALAVLGVHDGHSHPLHQGRQQQERPAWRRREKTHLADVHQRAVRVHTCVGGAHVSLSVVKTSRSDARRSDSVTLRGNS